VAQVEHGGTDLAPPRLDRCLDLERLPVRRIVDDDDEQLRAAAGRRPPHLVHDRAIEAKDVGAVVLPLGAAVHRAELVFEEVPRVARRANTLVLCEQLLGARHGDVRQAEPPIIQHEHGLRVGAEDADVPIDVLHEYADDDDVGIVAHALRLQREQHLVGTVAVHAEVQHLPARQGGLQEARPDVRLFLVLAEGEGVADEHDAAHARRLLVAELAVGADAVGIGRHPGLAVDAQVPQIRAQRPAEERVVRVVAVLTDHTGPAVAPEPFGFQPRVQAVVRAREREVLEVVRETACRLEPTERQPRRAADEDEPVCERAGQTSGSSRTHR
jgi:hypothetical protein